jgi:SAM-dependent methyltransferase
MSFIDTALRNSDDAFRKKFMAAVNYGHPSAKIGMALLDPRGRNYRAADILGALYEVYRSRRAPMQLSLAALERAAQAKVNRMKSIIPRGSQHWAHLDIGCGTGVSGAALAGAMSCDYTVLVDTRRPLVENLLFVEAPSLTEIDAAMLEGERVPEAYDIVSCFYALHHNPPSQLLRTVANLLRDGGYFICCEYDVRSPVEKARATTLHVGYAIHELPLGLTKKEFEDRLSSPVLYFTSRDELVRLAHEAGLKFIKSTDVRETDGQYFAIFRKVAKGSSAEASQA